LEILALFCAALFAQAGHDGTSNAFQEKVGSAIGAMNPRPLTMLACQTAVTVLTNPRCDLLHSLDAGDRSRVWKTLITLIKEADGEDQKRALNASRKILETSTFDLNNEKHRMCLLTIAMKCAAMAPFARPFPVSMKWQKLMTEELFGLGDQEMKRKIDFSSKYNSRDHHNKEECQIELLENLAIPLFEVLAAMMGDLSCLRAAANENLGKWKTRL